MMQMKSILEILLIAFLVGACSPGTPFSAAESISTQTLSVSNTFIPTSLPTATSLPDAWEASKSCVTEYPKKPDNIQLEGVAVLRSLRSTVLSLNLSLQNLKDGSSKIIDTASQPVWNVDISSDGQILAYTWFNTAISKWELVLADSTGHPQDVVWSSDQEFSFQGWLNNKQLIIQDSKYIVIDPDQNSQVNYSFQYFPEFNLYHSDYYVSFDPLLSKAIYRNGKINILDLNSRTFVTQMEDGYDRTPIVGWRPSSDEAAVVSSIPTKENLYGLPDEIFVVEKDGQVRQLTHLYDAFGLPLAINSLSWSPDGSKIAFWLHDKDANTTLMVTDSVTGNSVNYCISNILDTSFPIGVSKPIWSPDGKYLMVENRYATDKNKVLIIDFSTNSAFPIAENASPVGWMEEEQ
jgi:dipeptidyl aminopeptidase/acylaminoacyl peptidase